MTSLNPVLTIEEQIAEGLLIHESAHRTERHEKVLAIMHEVDFDPEKLCKKKNTLTSSPAVSARG